jgi:4-amino-4-deoxy-L-arabinose transferase-like glycosyltransferase
MTNSRREKSRVHTGMVLLLLFCAALSLRLLHIHERRQLPDYARPTMDSKYHDDWAWGLASGQWEPRLAATRSEPYFRAPLYPYALSGVYRVFGRNYDAVRLFQALIGSINVVILFLVSCRLFGQTAALLSSLLFLAYWPLTYFDGELLIPALAVFLDLSLILFLILASRSQSWRIWALSGLVLGLSAITRPNVLLAVPVIGVWIWRVSRLSGPRVWRQRVMAFCLGALLIVGVVTVRNAIVGRDLVLIASQGGVNFYIGNNPHSNGVTAIVPGTRGDWWGGFDDTRRIAEASTGGKLKPSEASAYWYDRSFAFWREQPTATAKLYLRKLALLLGNSEVSNNRQVYFMRAQSNALKHLPVNFAFILGFSILGLSVVLCRRPAGAGDRQNSRERLSRLLPLYFAVPYAVSVILFFITSRYRLPICAVLLPYAGCGMHEAWLLALIRHKSGRFEGVGESYEAELVGTDLRKSKDRGPLGLCNTARSVEHLKA